MNKIYYLLAVAAVAVLAGCSKIPGLSDEPFTITVRTVQAKAVWADIMPETNDFKYNFGTVTVKDYETKYKSDEALIKAIDKEDKEYWEKNLKDLISFSDAYLCTGAYFLNSSYLEPETEYYVFAFPYDDSDNPICKVVKQRFTTTAYKPSDIDFTVALNGSSVTVTPSNDNDPYYFDYDTVEYINEDFAGSPVIFYSYLVYKYEEYDFMSGMTVTGACDSDMADYFDMKSGQEFYLVASGYDNGVNSRCRIFKLTYAGEGLPGKVERYEDPLDPEAIYGSSRVLKSGKVPGKAVIKQ